MRSRIEIKGEAKQLLRSGQVSPLIMTAILLVISFALSRVVDLVEGGSLFSSFQLLMAEYEAILTGDTSSYEELLASFPSTGLLGTFLSIIVSLVTTVLQGGYFLYLMGIRQGSAMPYSTLFDGFSQAGKLIWCSILMGVKIALWSMLFVIPGIIASYRYRFALYNVLTDESLSAGEAIKLSCQQTQGIKGSLFVLDLSFFGWSFLSMLTLGILDIWLTPYISLCNLAYFEDSQRRLGRGPANDYRNPRPRDPWEL